MPRSRLFFQGNVEPKTSAAASAGQERGGFILTARSHCRAGGAGTREWFPGVIFGSLGEGDFELPSGPQDLWQDGLSTRPKTDWSLTTAGYGPPTDGLRGRRGSPAQRVTLVMVRLGRMVQGPRRAAIEGQHAAMSRVKPFRAGDSRRKKGFVCRVSHFPSPCDGSILPDYRDSP